MEEAKRLKGLRCISQKVVGDVLDDTVKVLSSTDRATYELPFKKSKDCDNLEATSIYI